MARKKLAKAKKTQVVGVSLPPEVLKMGKALAFRREVSFSRLVSDLIRRNLEAAK